MAEQAEQQENAPQADQATQTPTEVPAVEPQVEQAPSRAAAKPPEGKHYFWGTGRRKAAVARVRIRPGTGKILINKREVNDYFTQDRDRNAAVFPLHTINMVKAWDVWVNVNGGGFGGQAGAVTLGLARALCKAMPDAESQLRGQGLLTRDARMKERKKYGQKGARKRFQFSKR